MRTCSVEGCNSKHLAVGYCKKHYLRFKRHGDPFGGNPDRGAAMDFYQNVVLPYKGDDCITWPFSKFTSGYGQLGVNRVLRPVHRLVCEFVNGPPPTPDHHAAHSCGRGADGCCTPRHLRWATRVENMADKLIHGTLTRGEQIASSKLTESQVIEIRSLKGKARVKDLAARFGITPGSVYAIQTRRRWAWLAQEQEQG